MPFDNANLNETTRILIDARGFIERGWCKGTQARDCLGQSINPRDEAAVEWCVYGALVAAGVPEYKYDHPSAIRLQAVIGPDIAGFNNTQVNRTPILAAFEAAISDV